MKRVVAFFDMFDEIPDNAHYLFSRKAEMPVEELSAPTVEETDEQKPAKIVSNNPKQIGKQSPVIYIHYYEVDDMDFENLMENTDFAKDSNIEKMKKFMQEYKIAANTNDH